MEMEIEEIRALVHGNVQMVMFRDFAARHARHLALAGYVRNMPDFTVEVVAQGFPDKLEKLIEKLHKGPFLSRVSRVDVEWQSPTQKFDGFQIAL